MAQVGGLGADLVDHVQVQLHPGLVGDGGQVEHGVGGAAQGHVHRLRVVEGGGGHDIPGTDVLLDQLHDLHARVLGQAQAGGVDGGDGSVAPQGHSDGLGQAVHGVGGVHAGAAAAGGAGVLRVVLHPVLVQLARVIGAHGLEHVAQAGAAAVGQMAGQHGAAGAEDGRDIQAGRGHKQAGHVLVAVGDHHQAVELMGHDHGLGGVGDQVPGDQGVLHAHMTHGDAVAHGDGGEHNGGAPGGPDPGLHRLGDLIQVHVAGHDLVIGADHAHQGAGELLVRIAQGVQQRTVGGALHPGLDLFRTHFCVTS